MMKTTKEEFAVIGLDNDGRIKCMGGQFKAKDCKEYFKSLREKI